MTASQYSIIQLADLLEELMEIAIKNDEWLGIEQGVPIRLRQIRGSKSVVESMELLAREIERRYNR